MENYFYSSKSNAFYPYSLKEQYELTHSWPDDAVAVSDEVYMTYSANPPAGKIRKGDNNGSPAWANIPQPTHDQQVMQAEAEKQSLLANAEAVTADWRTELALGIISNEDKAKLTEWMQYIKAVKAVDVSTAPDISWPEPPAA